MVKLCQVMVKRCFPQCCTYLVVVVVGPLPHPLLLYTIYLGLLTLAFLLLITLSLTRVFIILKVRSSTEMPGI